MKVTHPAIFSLAGCVQKPAQHKNTGGRRKRKEERDREREKENTCKESFIKNTISKRRKERQQYLLLNTKLLYHF